jgi:hypothetical protein
MLTGGLPSVQEGDVVATYPDGPALVIDCPATIKLNMLKI